MNETTISYTQNVIVTDEDIDDIVATALEGGINYWCKKAEVNGEYLGQYASDQISRNGELKLYLEEPVNDTDMFVLNKERFLDGLKQYLADPHKPYDITYTKSTEVSHDHIIEYVNENCLDCCNVDATVADMIIQYALFDEIVFG